METDTKIILHFGASEMKRIEVLLNKHYGSKIKTKKELKTRLGWFISSMFAKGVDAVENDRDYMEIK